MTAQEHIRKEMQLLIDNQKLIEKRLSRLEKRGERQKKTNEWTAERFQAILDKTRRLLAAVKAHDEFNKGVQKVFLNNNLID